MCELDTMTAATKNKQEVWNEFHKARTSCPLCHRTMTTRTLRWRHKCQQKPREIVALDEASEAQRREELERRVRESLARRLGTPELAGK